MARKRTKRNYTISDLVRNKKPKVAFTGYSYLGGLKIPSVILNKFKKGKLSEDAFVRNVTKYNADKMSGEPERVIRSALLRTDDRVALEDRLGYLEEQSRRMSFWNENENREERSYRSSLMSAMNKMNKAELRDIQAAFGSTIDLDSWRYSEEEQGMVAVKGNQMFVLGFNTQFDGNYESNVLTLTPKNLPGGIHA